MTSSIRDKEPVTLPVGTPGVPWGVRRVRVALTDPVRLSYELEASAPGNLLERRDQRNRLAIEAFSALRLPDMLGDLRRYLASLKGSAAGRPEQGPMLDALGDLVVFVRRFGPLGIGWGMTLPVSNPVADDWERKLDDAKWRARGIDPDTVERESRSPSYWVASFYGQGAGRWGAGQVRRERAWRRDEDLEHRLELDDTIPSDLLNRIQSEQEDLRQALEFAEVIARDNLESIRALIRATRWARGISLRGIDPRGTDWRRVRRGGPSLGRRAWDPFAPGEDTDWRLFARMLLSNLIGRQLSYVLPYVDVDDGYRFGLDLRPTSVLEVIYLQLFAQVRDRLEFGIGWCSYCGGAILRTRRPESVTRNAWHAGRCGNAGRGRRYREKGSRDDAPRPE